MDLPGRHGAEINASLELSPLPTGTGWDGSIAYLDRDGVLNLGKSDYINTISELKVIEGAGSAVGELRRAGFRICVVTNQSPIGRGLWDELQLSIIHEELKKRLLAEDGDAELDLILYSPFVPWSNSYIRKPQPGMLEIGRQIISSSENGSTISKLITAGEYANDRPAEGSRSCIVGDRPADISAGLAHGVRIFHVDDREGHPSVTGRILDATDGGDKF